MLSLITEHEGGREERERLGNYGMFLWGESSFFLSVWFCFHIQRECEITPSERGLPSSGEQTLKTRDFGWIRWREREYYVGHTFLTNCHHEFHANSNPNTSQWTVNRFVPDNDELKGKERFQQKRFHLKCLFIIFIGIHLCSYKDIINQVNFLFIIIWKNNNPKTNKQKTIRNV